MFLANLIKFYKVCTIAKGLEKARVLCCLYTYVNLHCTNPIPIYISNLKLANSTVNNVIKEMIDAGAKGSPVPHISK